MASKRSRIVPSSSQGEIGLYANIQPLELPIAPWGQKCRQHTQPPPKNSNQAPVTVSKRPRRPNIKLLEQQPQPRQGIFTLNSPIGETNDFVSKEPPDEGFRAFLECCSLCNKKLKQDKDVYMYGYLTAFCSPECRNDQMALDGFNKKNDAERKTKRMAFFGKSNAAKQ